MLESSGECCHQISGQDFRQGQAPLCAARKVFGFGGDAAWGERAFSERR